MIAHMHAHMMLDTAAESVAEVVGLLSSVVSVDAAFAVEEASADTCTGMDLPAGEPAPCCDLPPSPGADICEAPIPTTRLDVDYAMVNVAHVSAATEHRSDVWAPGKCISVSVTLVAIGPLAELSPAQLLARRAGYTTRRVEDWLSVLGARVAPAVASSFADMKLEPGAAPAMVG